PVVTRDRLAARAGAIVESGGDGRGRRPPGLAGGRVPCGRPDLGPPRRHCGPDDLAAQPPRPSALPPPEPAPAVTSPPPCRELRCRRPRADDDRHAWLPAPPRVLRVGRADLVAEHADPVADPVLDPPDDHALVLQRAGISEQQADPGHADVHNSPYPGYFGHAKEGPPRSRHLPSHLAPAPTCSVARAAARRAPGPAGTDSRRIAQELPRGRSVRPDLLRRSPSASRPAGRFAPRAEFPRASRRRALRRRSPPPRSELRGLLDHLVGLDHVVLLDLVSPGDHHAAL